MYRKNGLITYNKVSFVHFNLGVQMRAQIVLRRLAEKKYELMSRRALFSVQL